MDRPNLARVARLSIAALLVLGGCSPAPSATVPLVFVSGPPPATPPPSAAAPSPTTELPSPSPAAGVIDPANFVAAIDNPWFPLRPGTTYTYEGTEDGEKLLETFEVTSETKVVDGVTCVVIHDNLKVAGVLEERTIDWYAQDRDGNVWYFGEDTAELDENGNVTSTAGTWTAGVDGALPGIFMPADPVVGYVGEQEIYPGTAEDRFVVILTNGNVKVKLGSYTNALVTVEWTILEPGVLSEKAYVAGIGQVKEFDVAGGTEFLQLTKVVTP